MAHYDDTITLGNIIAALSFIFLALTTVVKIGKAYSNLESRMAVLETKINVIYTWFEHQVNEATSISAKLFHGELKDRGEK